jgi:hypothetical protein
MKCKTLPAKIAFLLPVPQASSHIAALGIQDQSSEISSSQPASQQEKLRTPIL